MTRKRTDEEIKNSFDKLIVPNIANFYKHPVEDKNEKLRRIIEGENRMVKQPLPAQFKSGLLGPPTDWNVFPKQAQAIQSASKIGQGVMVFCAEAYDGFRCFVTAHPEQVWMQLSNRDQSQRCFYEVILEGAVSKLYFDLEFHTHENMKNDGSTMVNTFIRICCHLLRSEFDVDCCRENIIDLTSTSTSKFSRHLIFPRVAFADNIHVGKFVRVMCEKISEWDQQNIVPEIVGVSLADVHKLFVQNSRDERVLFCDQGVYTKNRNFRTYWSTKFSKNTPLTLAKENQYTIPNCVSLMELDKQVFIDSLITTVSTNCRILSYNFSIGHNKSLIDYTLSNQISTGSNSLEYHGQQSTPFPEVDNFITALVKPGRIRCWYYFSQRETLVYEINHHRFCYNVGRAHKSNGVMYVVNLNQGSYYQKCHDPDCQDFKSEPKNLPEKLLAWKTMTEDDFYVDGDTVNGDTVIESNCMPKLDCDGNDCVDLYFTLPDDNSPTDEEMVQAAEDFDHWEQLTLCQRFSSSSDVGSQNSHKTPNSPDVFSLLKSVTDDVDWETEGLL